MRILIDTNILINLEDDQIIDQKFSSFYSYAKANNCNVYIHSASKIDLQNDKNIDRKEISLSKINKYEIQPNPAKITEEFINIVGELNSNDSIDNKLLFQVYSGYIDLLVTQDKKLQRKAEKIKLSDKVLNVNNALRFLKEEYSIIIPNHPELRHVPIREIIDLKRDVFFDSLRKDYNGFDDWFDKCARENRYAYVLFIENKLCALLIYNIETPSDHMLRNVFNSALKMCTFKVADNVLGHKMGELFVRKMIELCINTKITTLYLTVFEKHNSLIRLLLNYGFEKYQTQPNGEIIILKKLLKPVSLSSNNNFVYPFYTDVSVNKFIIPIQESFYSKLFKDGGLRQGSIFDESTSSFKEIEGKTIEKAYLCKSKTKNISQGDILLFYSSKKYKSIEPIGILDSISYSNDADEIYNKVSKRTVYSIEDIKGLVKDGDVVTILMFRLINYLRDPIRYKEIKDFVSLRSKIVTITKLQESEYQILKDNKRFDERYIVD